MEYMFQFHAFCGLMRRAEETGDAAAWCGVTEETG